MKRRGAKPRGAVAPRSRGSGATTSAAPAALALHGTPEPSARETAILTRLAWALAGALAIALVIIVAGPHSIGDYFTETDFYGAYAEGARLIQAGTLDPSRYSVVGPVYEVTLALAGFVIRDLFVAAEMISILSTVTTLLLWFAILRQRIGARVAIFAALFMATNTDFFRYGFSATTDAFGMMLQALALWLLLTRSGHAGTWVAGLVTALAFLTRYNAIYLVPAALAVLLAGAAAVRAGRAEAVESEPRPSAMRSIARRLPAALAFLGGFAILVLPWVLYSIAGGQSVSIQLHHNIAFEVFARPQGIVWDDYQKLMQPQFGSLWDVIARDPGAVFSRMLFNLWDHLRLDARDLLGWPVAAAAVLGAALALWTGAVRRLWPVLAAGALLFLTLVPVFHAARYSLGLLPVYAALAGALFGLPAFALAAGRGSRVWLKPMLAAIPLALAIAANVAAQKETLRMLPREVRESAAVLRTLAAPGDRIIARKGHIAYHAGLEAVAFPFADSLAQLAEVAHAQQARWLYVSWPEVQMRPRLAFLMDTTATVPGLTVRNVTTDHPGVVYEIGPAFGEIPAWARNDTLLSYHTARAQLMVDASNRAALYALAQLEHHWNRMDAALPLLTRYVMIDPGEFSAWLLLGDTALRLNALDTSARAFDTALRLRPESVAARVGLGWAYLQAGREREAAAYWQPVIASTTDPATLQSMAVLFQSLGDAASAQRAVAALRQQSGGGR
jgi:tetratricopeptide (TPR) repeat protein